MIDYIYGTVMQKGLGYVIVECNNIGYKLLVSQNTSYELELDKTQNIYTHLIVKEDGLTFIGFSSITERDMFEILISVSKIGAKIALSILSAYPPPELASYIKAGDIVSLSKIPGLGKKTSERLVLELKDKVDLFLDSNIVIPSKNNISTHIENEALQEAIDGLTMLGFSQKEAITAAEKAYSMDESANVQTIIKTSLSLLKK